MRWAVLASAVVVAAASHAPAFAHDFPDPNVVAVPGGYAAYATGSGGTNLQVITSPDLQHWSAPRDPLPVLPSWAVPGLTWAPGVIRIGGQWVMYFAAHRPSTNTQCLGVATSVSVTGPFVSASSRPLICQPPGSIDASPFVASNGVRYLVWKSDDDRIRGVPTRLWSAPLSADGLALVGSPALLLTADAPWQDSVIEGPDMVQDGPVELLFFGGNHWDTAGSGIGYAVCATASGPCVDASLLGPWLHTTSSVVGPQGPSVFVDHAGQLRMAYAAWSGPVGYQHGGARTMWIGRLSLGLVPALS